MKSTWLIRSAIIVVLVSVAGLIYFNMEDSKKDSKEPIKSETFNYEILDASVELTEDVNAWVEDNKVKDGFYTKATKEEVFILISGGKQKTTGFGISLNNVEQEGQVLHVDYEVIKPSKNDDVKNEETMPFMLLRVNSEKAEVKGKIAPIKEKTAE